jgi:ABC-2 type transport system ATP-binding protein
MARENADNHILYLLKKVGLYDRRNTKIGHFSRGMRQRLGLAKTLINQPKIIFLDEPTLGLDPTGQRDIHNLILELNKSMNITVFITSHLLKDIEVLCNKVAIVKHGKLLVEDTIQNLQERYSEAETISFKTSNNALAFDLIQMSDPQAQVTLDDDIILFKFDKPSNIERQKQKIIEILFVNNIDIYEISKHKTTIEDIFINLVSTEDEAVVQNGQ